jgi:hypothetical protein
MNKIATSTIGAIEKSFSFRIFKGVTMNATMATKI